MAGETLFRSLGSTEIAQMIRSAKQSVCFAGPGLQLEPANAIADVVKRLPPEMITVCIDFDERAMRMGYGDIAAVKVVTEAGIAVRNSPGLRTAFIIVDDQGYLFTPTALYLEAEAGGSAAPNAMRLSRQQAAEMQARLSPAAKAIAQLLAVTPEEKARIAALPVEVETKPVSPHQLDQVAAGLKVAPPVKFDVARQVRVFEPYLQYVELSLSGAAIQRHRLAIPPSIQKIGGSKDLEGRLKTTFDLIEKNSKLSSKALEDTLNEIRKDFTKSLGNGHGRVVLKGAKPQLLKKLTDFRKDLEKHRNAVEKDLQKHLDASRKQIVEYYLPIIKKNPPDALLGQLFSGKVEAEDARTWLENELDRVFPTAKTLVQDMKLEDNYKDVTFETLNRKDFFDLVSKAYPLVNWEKPYSEFKAAGETGAR